MTTVNVDYQTVTPRYDCGTVGKTVDVSYLGEKRAIFNMQTAADKHATSHGCGIATDKKVHGIVQRIGVIV